MWKETLRYSIIIFLGTMVSRGFVFLHRILIIRLMGVDGYAVFALMFNLFVWLMVLSNFSLDSAISKKASELRAIGDYSGIKKAYKHSIQMIFLFSLVSVAIGYGFTRQYKISTAVNILFFFGLFPVAVSSLNEGVLKGYEKFKWSAFNHMLSGFSRFGFLVMAMFMIPGNFVLDKVLNLFTFACFLPFIISTAVVLRIIFGDKSKDRTVSDSNVSYLDLLHFSKWVTATDLLNTGIIMVNTWIISLTSLEDVAVFNVVIVLFSVFQMAFSSITTVLIPQVSSYAAQGKGVRLPGEKLLIGILTCAVLLAVVMTFMPKQEIILYKLFHSEIYVKSFKYLAILVIGFPFRIFTMSSKGITQGLGDTRSIAVISLVVAICNIGIFSLMYTRFHITGALIAMVISYVLEYLLTRYRATRLIEQLRCQQSLEGAAV